MKYQVLDTLRTKGKMRVHVYGCRDISTEIKKLRVQHGWTFEAENLREGLIKESSGEPEVMDGYETPESFAEKSFDLAPCAK